MDATRFVSLLGLGFGDCGKGVFTDALCRQWPVHTVVRFNGGAQAGHNVVLPDQRQHTFSQFSAGTFVPGVATVLAYPVVVHPTALLVEQAHLRAIGVGDALDRLLVDSRCRITTPFHQAAGRLRELLRASQAHGTCGVGVGETVRHALQYPDHVLRFGDLIQPALAMQKLEIIRHDLLTEFAGITSDDALHTVAAKEYRLLVDSELSERWLSTVDELMRRVSPASSGQIAERLDRPGTVLFEGAQGALLDEWRGFHPHTTWSSISTEAVESVSANYGFVRRFEHLGVLRAYLTRHGEGPFPTFDASLNSLSEPHNANDGWQGFFRRGHPDAVLLRYALSVVGHLDGLLISHLDVFDQIEALQWCEAYHVAPQLSDDHPCYKTTAQPDLITDLPNGPVHDLGHQAMLTSLLSTIRPKYDSQPIASSFELLERVSTLAKCQPYFCSSGQTYEDVRCFRSKGMRDVG